MKNRQYFGTDGIRGAVGSACMTPSFLLKLGWAIGCVLKQHNKSQPTILIGRDTRLSGEMLESALVSGLLSAGCNVTLVGILPTPGIAFLTKTLSMSAGLIISASHNPYQDNGVKCINANGMKFSDEWELAVEAQMQNEMIIANQDSLGRVRLLTDAAEQYQSHYKKQFEKKLSLSGMKIILDCANGATSPIAASLFRSFGATVNSIHDTPNGININAKCGATDLESLQSIVLAEKADCGLAFDGDGDRLIMVDHCGEVVDGDEMLGILAIHGKYAGVVGTLMSNLGLEKAMLDHRITFDRAAVGDRYVLAGLQEKGWKLGGESSGHVINLDYSQTGDGIVTGLQVLQIMQQSGQSLHSLKAVVQKRPQILINVSVENPKLFSKMTAINDAIAKAQADLGQKGRVLLRASGTESCVRVMVEADDETQGTTVAKTLAAIVKQAFIENTV